MTDVQIYIFRLRNFIIQMEKETGRDLSGVQDTLWKIDDRIFKLTTELNTLNELLEGKEINK